MASSAPPSGAPADKALPDEDSALKALVEASKRVAREKAANRDAATASQRAAAMALEKVSKRCDTAEQEVQRLRAELTAVKSALDEEKKRATKQAQLSAAALQAANKRAEQFEQKYEAAHAEAVEERQRLLSYRAAAADLNRQLDVGGATQAPTPDQLLRSNTRQSTPASVPKADRDSSSKESPANAKAAYAKPAAAKAVSPPVKASPPPAKAAGSASKAAPPAKAAPAAKAAPPAAAKASPARTSAVAEKPAEAPATPTPAPAAPAETAAA